jgi:hypothetical protein
MNKPLSSFCLVFAVAFILSQMRAENADNALSPDKQWRYQPIENHWPGIYRASTAEKVLDLMANARTVPHTEHAEVIWAPDSKRFAFNYGPPTAPHSTYVTTAFNQLRGDEWTLSPSPIDEDSSEKTFAELAKHLPGLRIEDGAAIFCGLRQPLLR